MQRTSIHSLLLVTSAALAASLLAPSRAHAIPPGLNIATFHIPIVAHVPVAALVDTTDTLTLCDGTVLRGHVAEIQSARRTVAFAPFGSTPRDVPLEQVASATGPGTVGLPLRTRCVPSSPAPGNVRVELESPDETQLIARDLELCATPCTLDARPGRVTLSRRDRDGFSLGSFDADVPPGGGRIRLHQPDGTLMGGGGAIAVLGAIGLAVSITALATSVTPSNPDQAMVTGVSGAGIGLSIAAIVGGTWMVSWANRPIERITPLAPVVAPVAGGVVAGVSVRF